VHEVAVTGLARHDATDVLGDQLGGCRVSIEHAVHVADETRAEATGQEVRIAVVSVPAAETRVVGDVPGALLQVAHEPTALEDLRQHIRGLLAGQVHSAELGDRIVAVLDEDLFVEFLGSVQAGGGIDGPITVDLEVTDELVEEQPPQALRAPAVPGEERTLDDFGQVDEGKHRSVEVREVPPQDIGLRRRELLGHIGHDDAS
jgi:hypothetical protein